MHRAFCTDLSATPLVISDSEAHHLLHVLRTKVGDTLIVFDGRGNEVTVRVRLLSRHDLTCDAIERRHVPRPTRASLTVAVSPPKGDRLKLVVEKLTELGVDHLILLQTARTVVNPGETRLDRLKSTVISASKQCGRAYLMELSGLQTFPDVLQTGRKLHTDMWLAHPANAETSHSDQGKNEIPATPPADQNRLLLVGPEGGFTEQEVSLAVSSGARHISWPQNILRIETAAIVFSTLLMPR